MDFVVSYIQEVCSVSLSSVLGMAKIIIPLMVVMELLRELKILNVIANCCKPFSKVLNMSENAFFPLVIGLILGLSYGAGVIIDTSKEGKLSKQDLYLLMVFLIACHSVFEDTLLFVTIGANGWILLLSRLAIAFILTFVLGRYYKMKSEKTI